LVGSHVGSLPFPASSLTALRLNDNVKQRKGATIMAVQKLSSKNQIVIP
jgi:hypothetical protein